VEGKNPLIMGTNRTPPPTPPNTATTPMANVTTKSNSGQIHQDLALDSGVAAKACEATKRNSNIHTQIEPFFMVPSVSVINATFLIKA